MAVQVHPLVHILHIAPHFLRIPFKEPTHTAHEQRISSK